MTRYRLHFIYLLCSLLFPAAGFLAWLWCFPFGLVDDAYIPMVYARNLAAGHGIVFFPGSDPVEGYTSPLWMLLLTGAEWVSLPLPSLAYWLSVFTSLVCIGLTGLLYRQIFSDEAGWFWPMMACTMLAADVSFPAWGSAGLETTLYAAGLLLLTHFLKARNSKLGARSADFAFRAPSFELRALSLWLFLLSLVRPEAPAFLLPLVFLQWWKGWSLKSTIYYALVYFLIPFCVFIAWRWLYFGYPLPNSFYAKHDFGGFVLLHRGVEYVLTFFYPRPIYLLAFFGLLIDSPASRKRTLVLWVFLLWHISLVVAEGGDHFALHRFMVPALPFLAILSTHGLHSLVQRYTSLQTLHSPLKKAMAHACILFLAAILVGGNTLRLMEYKANDRYQFSKGLRWHLDEVSWAQGWAKIGKWLKEKYPPGTKIAVVTAGAIPYYSELPAIDIMGINNEVIAHSPAPDPNRVHPGHEKSNAEYVLEQRPEWVQLFPMLFFSSSPFPQERLEEMLTYPAQKALWQHPQFQNHYRYTVEETSQGVIGYFERTH